MFEQSGPRMFELFLMLFSGVMWTVLTASDTDSARTPSAKLIPVETRR